MFRPYKQSLKSNSRSLRTNMTDAEQALWRKLRRKQIHQLQFYRQKPLLNFIVDFYCPKAKLVVEVDGSQHFERKRLNKDTERDYSLKQLGITVLRFDNRQVLTQINDVLEVIVGFVTEVLKESKEKSPSIPL